MRHPDELLGKPQRERAARPGQRLHPPAAPAVRGARVAAAGRGRRAPGQDDEALFGPGFVDAMVQLEQNGGRCEYTGEKWVYRASDYPAQDVSLRDAEGDRFARARTRPTPTG